ncbi:MAG: hypothetical protein ACRD1P_13740 [Thermoanaerobaculia bacterium]
MPLCAQDRSVGASVGLVNDIQDTLRLDGFRRTDWNAWVCFELEERVVLRATVGSLLVKGANAGLTVSLPPGAPPAPLPDLTDRINYLTVGVSYEFWEGDYTSGLFGGLGGYRVNPRPVDPQFEPYRDVGETVFGWHAGADASLRIVSRFSLVGRLTFYRIDSASNRSLLTANAGIEYRF